MTTTGSSGGASRGVKSVPRRGGLLASGMRLSAISLSQLVANLLARSIYAGLFGTSREMDAFLLVMGAVSWFTGMVVVAANKGLVPKFVEVRERLGEARGWEMASTIINGLLALSVVCIVVCVMLASRVATVLSPGRDVVIIRETVVLVRLAVPIVATNLISGVLTALLFTYADFAVPQLLRLIGLGVTVGAVLLLSPSVGIYSLPLGMLIDGLLTCAVLVCRIRQRRLPYRVWVFRISDVEVLSFLRNTAPLIGAALFSRSQELIDRLFASALGAGAISYLNYAFLLVRLPATVLSSGVQVMFPELSRLAAAGNYASFRKCVERAIGLALFLAVPAFVGILCLGRPAIVALFQHGMFNEQSTLGTWQAVPWYGGVLLIGLPSGVLSYALYSLQETRVVLWIGVWDCLSNLCLNYVCIRWFGYPGIAIATSAVLAVDAALLVYYVQRTVGGLDLRAISGSIVRAAAASAGMAIVLVGITSLMPRTSGVAAQVAILTLEGCLGAAIYGVVAVAIRSREALYVAEFIRERGGNGAVVRLGRRLSVRSSRWVNQ